MTRNGFVLFAMGMILGSALSAAALYAVQSESDPTKLSPQYYRIRVENERVRVLEYHLGPGQRETMHSHVPGVVYSTSDSTIRVTSPDGTVADHQVKAGEVSWRDATTHALENIGNTEVRAIAIELKPCR